MNESMYAQIIWQIERGLRHPTLRSAKPLLVWLTDSPLNEDEGQLLGKMSQAMRLSADVTKVVHTSSFSDFQTAELVIILGQEAANSLKLNRSESGKVFIHETSQTSMLITYHPRELLTDPLLKRQAWAELQVAMAYLKL